MYKYQELLFLTAVKTSIFWTQKQKDMLLQTPGVTEVI